MANTANSSATAAAMETAPGGFADMVPASVPVAKVMSPNDNRVVWEEIYAKAGIASKGEDVKRALRCAVYLYWAINGTSPEGSYTGNIVTAKGTSFPVSIVVAASTRLAVRQFARANATEALAFFRATRVLQQQQVLVAKADELSVTLDSLVGMVDFFDSVAGLTPVEKACQSAMKNYGLVRARNSRGGRDTQTLVAERRNENLDAQVSHVMPPAENRGW